MDSIDEVLASDTRREILERLSEKNHRPADLSRELRKDKSTIVEHLEKLRQAGLVERLERDGHKWVFYRLSRDGESFFPNRKRRLVFLAVALLSLAGAMLSLFAYEGSGLAGNAYTESAPAQSAKAFDTRGMAAGSAPAQENPPLAAAIANQSENATTAASTQVFSQPRNEAYVYAAVCLLAVFLVAGAQFILARASPLRPPRK